MLYSFVWQQPLLGQKYVWCITFRASAHLEVSCAGFFYKPFLPADRWPTQHFLKYFPIFYLLFLPICFHLPIPKPFPWSLQTAISHSNCVAISIFNLKFAGAAHSYHCVKASSILGDECWKPLTAVLSFCIFNRPKRIWIPRSLFRDFIADKPL